MPNKSMHPASRAQFSIESGQYRAVTASVGATRRSFSHAGGDLVVSFHAEEIRPLYRGANLVPWPNRIADGAYGCNGQEEQLPINEVDRRRATRTVFLRLKPPTRSPTRGSTGAFPPSMRAPVPTPCPPLRALRRTPIWWLARGTSISGRSHSPPRRSS